MNDGVFHRLTSAWHSASAGGSLPTLSDLQQAGFATDHPGFALLGRVEDVRRGVQRVSFKFIEAGPDHLSHGGHVMTGHHIDEIVHPSYVERLNTLYASLIERQEPHLWRCINMARNSEPMSYTRALAPIADDVGDGRCLAGVWIWHPDELGTATN